MSDQQPPHLPLGVAAFRRALAVSQARGGPTAAQRLANLKAALNAKKPAVCCSGVVPWDSDTTLFVRPDATKSAAWRPISVTNPTTEDLEFLLSRCSAAAFGRGNELVHDESYRKALALSPSDFFLHGTHTADALAAATTSTLHRLLGPGLASVRPAVYRPGDFFKPHADTLRPSGVPGEHMFGSLVIVLPFGVHSQQGEGQGQGHAQAQGQGKGPADEASAAAGAGTADTQTEKLSRSKADDACTAPQAVGGHTGGDLRVTHDGFTQILSLSAPFTSTPAGPGAPPSLEAQVHAKWAAFYSDAVHEVLPVTSGYRLSLTYNLYGTDPVDANIEADGLTLRWLAASASSASSKADKPASAAASASSSAGQKKAVEVGSPVCNALQDLFASPLFLPFGGRLVVPCSHRYPITAPDIAVPGPSGAPLGGSLPRVLKGVDAVLLDAAKEQGLQAELVPPLSKETASVAMLNMVDYYHGDDDCVADEKHEEEEDEADEEHGEAEGEDDKAAQDDDEVEAGAGAAKRARVEGGEATASLGVAAAATEGKAGSSLPRRSESRLSAAEATSCACELAAMIPYMRYAKRTGRSIFGSLEEGTSYKPGTPLAAAVVEAWPGPEGPKDSGAVLGEVVLDKCRVLLRIREGFKPSVDVTHKGVKGDKDALDMARECLGVAEVKPPWVLLEDKREALAQEQLAYMTYGNEDPYKEAVYCSAALVIEVPTWDKRAKRAARTGDATGTSANAKEGKAAGSGDVESA